MLITDQVATAPCTDRVQEWFRTFEAKLHDIQKHLRDRREHMRFEVEARAPIRRSRRFRR